ncbi:hypothetical protein [Agriterribacter sp.]|uniref:hypothetical protein n=1 Tax=Agriterribacter sp. TaxID=2821509 RepID=UPI002D1C8E6D|nr:hypothetical protein [Agriterribacter sp.]HRP56912.1 hypothetical protein [Agriterribacter sp.]
MHSIVGRDSLIGAYKGKIFSNDAGSEVFKIIIRSDSTGEQFVLYCAKKDPVKIEREKETYYKHNNRYFNKDSHVLTDSLMLQKIKGLEWVLQISYDLIL